MKKKLFFKLSFSCFGVVALSSFVAPVLTSCSINYSTQIENFYAMYNSFSLFVNLSNIGYNNVPVLAKKKIEGIFAGDDEYARKLSQTSSNYSFLNYYDYWINVLLNHNIDGKFKATKKGRTKLTNIVQDDKKLTLTLIFDRPILDPHLSKKIFLGIESINLLSSKDIEGNSFNTIKKIIQEKYDNLNYESNYQKICNNLTWSKNKLVIKCSDGRS